MIILEAKKHFRLRVIEWWSAFTLTGWGTLVLLFPQMFQEPVFHGMSQFAPQHIWGLGALLAGVIRLFALFVNGFWSPTPLIRWVTAMAGIFVWFSVTAGMFYAPYVSTGLWVYFCHMMADMYSAYRSASDFMENEFERRVRDQGVVTHKEEADNVHSIERAG